jgi:catechol 2,3-dioxygenase-like lactoylglutathione lyase family enzyme
MSADWYARPLVFVSDIDTASAFYVGKLDFSEAWRHVEGGKALVAQIERNGCELLLTCQWPDRVGAAIQFVSLDPEEFNALGAACAANGVETKPGQWGYELLVIADPDGNQLFFPRPS